MKKKVLEQPVAKAITVRVPIELYWEIKTETTRRRLKLQEGLRELVMLGLKKSREVK